MEGLPGTRVDPRTALTSSALNCMVERVTSLHEIVRCASATSDGHRYNRLVTDPVDVLRHFGDSLVVRDGCASLVAAATTAWLKKVPIIPQHGDLYFGNILCYKRDFYIFDWESYGVIDLPMYDLVTLIVSLLHETGENSAFWDTGLKARIPELVMRYRKRIGLSDSDVSLLLPLGLINWFVLQYRDGRQDFSKRMYSMIEQYFQYPKLWAEVFCAR